MDFVIKTSEDYLTVDAQFINPSDIAYREELGNINDLRFVLNLNDPQIALIKEYKKIVLYSIEGGNDVKIWSGYISKLEYSFNNVIVTASDEKRFLQKKIIYQDKNWSGVAIGTVLSTLVSEANARSGGVKGNLSSTTSLTDTITKDFSEGTTYYNILNELAELLDAEWKIAENEIIFESTIGEDKTSGANFVELVRSAASPNENTITQLRIIQDGNLISTAVIGKDGSGTSQQDDNTSEFGFVESAQSFSDGDLINQTTEYLDKHKVSQKELDITVNTESFELSDINIGDLVQVRIESGSTLIDQDESYKVIAKEVKFVNKKAVFDILVAKTKVDINSTENFLQKVDQRIKTLELK